MLFIVSIYLSLSLSISIVSITHINKTIDIERQTKTLKKILSRQYILTIEACNKKTTMTTTHTHTHVDGCIQQRKYT